MEARKPSAVICDDAPGFLMLMQGCLAEQGIDVAGVGETWADAERLAPGRDVVVVDLWMPTFDPGALARVRATAPAAILVVLTALEPATAAERLAPVEVDLLMSKATPPDEVARQIAARARAAA